MFYPYFALPPDSVSRYVELSSAIVIPGIQINIPVASRGDAMNGWRQSVRDLTKKGASGYLVGEGSRSNPPQWK
jgi:hypothetical protein